MTTRSIMSCNTMLIQILYTGILRNTFISFLSIRFSSKHLSLNSMSVAKEIRWRELYVLCFLVNCNVETLLLFLMFVFVVFFWCLIDLRWLVKSFKLYSVLIRIKGDSTNLGVFHLLLRNHKWLGKRGFPHSCWCLNWI